MKKDNLIIKQQGMTLIEIMVALMLGAFLLAGVMQIFLSSKQTYRMQDNMSRIQENGRFAMEFISRDIRIADYWGCVDATNIENKLNSSTTYDFFASGLAGVNDDNNGNDGDVDNDENGNTIWDGTDSFTLRGASDGSIGIANQPTGTNASLQVVNNSGLQQDDVVIISNCVAGDIFQITDVTGATVGFDNVVHNTGGTFDPGNNSARLEIGPEPSPPDPLANRYGQDSNILKLSFKDYQIRISGGEPFLSRSINGAAFQSLVEGIEDMQVLYGEDTDADGTPNHYVSANLVTDMDQVVSTRVILTVRSLDDNLTNNGDGRLRRTFSSTIVLRNRVD